MKEYHNYIFDMYGTLVDISVDETRRKFWEQMSLFYGYHGALYEPEEMHQTYLRAVQNKENLLKREYAVKYTHESHPEILYDEIFQELYTDKGVIPDRSLIIHTAQMFRACSVKHIRLYAHARELLTALRQAGKKVCLLSNAQRIFTEYEINYLGISDLFDGIQISSDYGCKKPDVRFYNILLERFGLKPEESLMIGNNMAEDIAGANRVGIDSFYIHSALSPRQKDGDNAGIHADYTMPNLNLRLLQKYLLDRS